MMPDYSFYTESYQGNQIAEYDFPRLITRAGVYLKGVACKGVVVEDDSYKMAACAVAEAWQKNEQGGDLVGQSVGSWSKSFAQKKPVSDRQRLFEAASLYLGDSVRTARWL